MIVETFRRINDRVERVSLTLAAVFLGTMTVVVFLEVIARYAFRYSFVWSEEAAIFCFEWITFLGAGVALRRNEHFMVDLLAGPLGPGSRLERLRKRIVQIAVLVFVLVLVVYGTEFAVLSLKRHSYALGIPIVHVTSAIPIAGIAMVLFALERLLLSSPDAHDEP